MDNHIVYGMYTAITGSLSVVGLSSLAESRPELLPVVVAGALAALVVWWVCR